MTEGWKTGKRNAGNPPMCQNSRKKRKLKYAVMEDDWGLGDGEDLKRMENEELAKRTFLQAGRTDCKAGKQEKQTIIRTWSEAELICREIVLESISQSRKTGKFMSDLGEQLRMMISDRESKLSQRDGGLPPDHQPSPVLIPDDLSNPEGRMIDSPRRVDDKVQEGRKHQGGRQETIKSMFAKKEHENVMKVEKEILKEERLENKRRLEIKWKGMKIHAARLRWAKEWLEEEIIHPVIEAGYRKKLEAERLEAREVSDDIMDMLMTEVKAHHDCGFSTACPGWWCMEVVQRRLAYKKPEGWKSDQKKDIIPEERKNLKRRREQFEIIPEDWKQ